MKSTALPAREKILRTAHDLFYRNGIRATGVDRIIAESGVAKLTFYRHFASKDELIRSFLEYRHEVWMTWFLEALSRHGAEAGGGLRPLLGAMSEWFSEPKFRGCAFINSVVEVGGTLPDAMAIARRHKNDMTRAIGDLLPDSSSRRAHAQAAALAVDGAIIRAQMYGAKDALGSLRLLVQALETEEC
jgi:AcrR family transcriptional regulator